MPEPGTPCLTILEIVKATQGTLAHGATEDVVCGVSTDTRTLAPGNLFIPLAGPNYNGHDYIRGAVAGGAKAFLYERSQRSLIPALKHKVARIEVDDTLRAFGDLAYAWRRRFSCPVIAVTGSAGKTTTKEMLASISAQQHRILKTDGNFNNLIGLPRTILGLKDETELAILELGTNAPGEIERLSRIAAPDIGVITNIGPAHLEGLGSLEAVREEKGSLFRVMNHQGIAILNLDDPQITILGSRWQGRKLTCSLNQSADITAENIRAVETGKCAFSLVIHGKRTDIMLSLPGRHNVTNAILAVAAASAAGLSQNAITEGLYTFLPVPGRMTIETLPSGATLVHDAYNANPLSMGEALNTLVNLSGGHRRILILGDMLELGNQAREYHEELGRSIAKAGIHYLLLKGDFAEVTAQAASASGMGRKQIFIFTGKEDALPLIGEVLSEDAWILIKGSRKMNLDELIPGIRGLGKREPLHY